MAVIGIDPGTALTGYGIIEELSDQSLQVIDFGVIRTGSNDKPETRLIKIFSQLNRILSIYKPEAGAVEKLFFQRNTRTAMSVGQARGVAILSLAEVGISISEYGPVEIKQAVVGYGKASKNQVQQMVKMLLNLREIPKPDDAADALAVAICHIHSRKMLALQQDHSS
ncbi:MAG: crossover junction endodeoxyribonuclease RuvC [Anaerolineaceae bacterium]|nr:crossover junction endodeoxyribonuclease RuvC [Anaerolineaceae bacterium]